MTWCTTACGGGETLSRLGGGWVCVGREGFLYEISISKCALIIKWDCFGLVRVLGEWEARTRLGRERRGCCR